MSKGGAGKVYFVLYLAVVLELLIIIVERDEAEEHLRSKTKQAMRIVESILSQLQSGAGTEAINTRPQDEITIPPPGIDIKDIFGTDLKSYRQYIVEVGVTDIMSSLTKRDLETEKEYTLRLRKLIDLANVSQLQYQIFYNSNNDAAGAPPFPNEEFFKKNKIDPINMQPGEVIPSEVPGVEWKLLGVKEINLDADATYNQINLANVEMKQFAPIYPANLQKSIGDKYAPQDRPADSIFFYSEVESTKLTGTSGLQKRSFVVFFQPPSQQGWYKLRFASKTNRILGVKGGLKVEEVEDKATVNIGTVQLTVSDLRKVKKELERKLEKYQLPTIEELAANGDIIEFNNRLKEAQQIAAADEKAEEIAGNINLYGYIVKLLAPGQSINFDQNRGSIEFNVRVMTPQPKLAKPQVASLPDYIASFDKIAAVFGFDISPYQGATNLVDGRVIDASNNTVARLQLQPLDQIAGSGVTAAPAQGATRQYRATVDKELSPGKYKVELTHRIGQQFDTRTTTLEIFPAKLTDESENALNNRFTAFAYYGYPLTFNIEPSSGGKIKANQFRIYVTSDNNSQSAPIEGLSVTNDNKINFTPEMKQITVKVTWHQDATGKEVDIFPAKSYEVKQEEPSISTNKISIDCQGPSTKIKVRVSGIRVTQPTAGGGKLATVKVDKGGEPQKRSGLELYIVSTEPMIDGSDGDYSIEFELTGKLDRGQTKVSGTIDVPIVAVATNPINGVKSEPKRQNITVNINYEPDRGGPRRSSGGIR